MKKIINRKEKGQTIVLVVISILIMVVMAALVVDGGNAYMRRRQAQTAADAAALAAAQEICINSGSVTDADEEAKTYALVQNDATSMIDLNPIDNFPSDDNDDSPYIILNTVTTDDGNQYVQIEVAVEITQPSFFLKILGRPTITVNAKAAASCFSVGDAGSLLPIAWTCRTPLTGEDLLGDDDCAIRGIPHSVFEDILAQVGPVDNEHRTGFFYDFLLDEGDGTTAASYHDDIAEINSDPKMVYVVADSLKVAGMLEDVCLELNTDTDDIPGVGTITCDFDGDGIIDIDGGAGRGWLLMNGDENQGAALLFCIVNGGDDCPTYTNTPHWYPGLAGGKTSAFGEIRDVRTGDIVLIPIFDAVCVTNDPINDGDNCSLYYGSGEDVTYYNGAAEPVYYRVNGFAAFYISCVSKGPQEDCPGKQRAIDADTIANNTSSVEGYFIEGYIPEDAGIGYDALDLGIYILSLTE